MTEEELMPAVAELARLVGKTALGYYGRGVDVEIKGDGSPVTVADRAAESVARDWIASRFPTSKASSCGDIRSFPSPGSSCRDWSASIPAVCHAAIPSAHLR